MRGALVVASATLASAPLYEGVFGAHFYGMVVWSISLTMCTSETLRLREAVDLNDPCDS